MKISPQKTLAGGLPAITSSIKHTFGEMGALRATRALLRVNQNEGFDCPGCAWPDPDHERSATEFCENGAKAVAEEATLKRVTPAFFKQHSIDDLVTRHDFWLSQQGRLTHPMLKRQGASHYEQTSWSDAFALVAAHLGALSTPNQATFYTSGRTSNEAAFLYQLFVRLYGTNNLPDCSNMCHESSGAALNESIGVGKGTVTLDDFDQADCILVIGQNPGTNHPRMLTSLQRAAKNGCSIVSINPLKEAGVDHFIHPQDALHLLGEGTKLTSLWVQPRINGDLPLLKGVMKAMLTHEERAPGTVFNHSFIERYTEGYAELVTDLEQVSWDLIVRESGVNRTQIEELAALVARSKRVIICWAMGLTQHKNGVATIQQAVNLLLLGGHFGRPGAGACPVRGHSNVQGDRTMGIWEKMPDWFLDKLGTRFGFTPPRDHGLDTVDSIRAMHAGEVKVFFGLGGNFLSATPDTDYVAKALQKCDLTVHVSTKLNRAHLVTGKTALILPCLGRTEVDLQASGPQYVTVENSMGVVHASQGHLAPASSELLSEVAIVAGVAKATLGNLVNWDACVANYDVIREHIAQVIPGFDDYSVRAKKPGGFYLPNAVRDKLIFNTRSQKANFKTHAIESGNLPKGHYWLMTIRSHDQFNTTLYGLDDRYRGIKNSRRVLFMNRDDIADAGWSSGTLVNITSHFGNVTRNAADFSVVPYDIPRRCLATYFPEANVLVPIESTADKSNTPTYKSLVVSLSESYFGS
jgi:molybdopterin-dependent oxidoreductase alpha subunit